MKTVLVIAFNLGEFNQHASELAEKAAIASHTGFREWVIDNVTYRYVSRPDDVLGFAPGSFTVEKWGQWSLRDNLVDLIEAVMERSA